MKRVSRAQLRGKSLSAMCKKAHTTTNEYGLGDKRVFCCGIWEAMTEEPVADCKLCGAFVWNEKPLSGEDMSDGHF